MALTKPVLFVCHHKGFHIVVYLDEISVLVCSKQAGNMAYSFLRSLLVCLGLHINFSSLPFALLRHFVSWGYVGILSIYQYLCHLIG